MVVGCKPDWGQPSGSEVVLENELKAFQGPSIEERRSVDETEVILRVNRVSILMREMSEVLLTVE